MNACEFGELETHVRASALYRVIEGMETACLGATTRSSIAARVREARDHFASLADAGRVRFIAIVLAAAAGGHFALLRWVPAQVAPAAPRGVWLLFAASATFVALCADRLRVSWKSSAVRRLWRATVRTE